MPLHVPEDIKAELDKARDRLEAMELPLRFEVKARLCPDITYLRIGNFEDYPGASPAYPLTRAPIF